MGADNNKKGDRGTSRDRCEVTNNIYNFLC